MLAEAECDLGVMMRNDPVELLDGDPWARAHWLAERCGLDAAAIWEWGVLERVTSDQRPSHCATADPEHGRTYRVFAVFRARTLPSR